MSHLREIDVCVLAALHELPKDVTLIDIAERLGADPWEAHESLVRLALREPDPQA